MEISGNSAGGRAAPKLRAARNFLSLTEAVQRRQDLVWMVGRRHLGINRGNVAVRPDENRNACGARRIRFRSAIGDGHRFVRVTQQIIGKAELLLERFIVFRAVHTAAENDGIFTFEILDSITEPIAFDRSPGCIGFRIPPDQNVFTQMVRERHGRPILVRDAKGGRLITNIDHGRNSLIAMSDI